MDNDNCNNFLPSPFGNQEEKFFERISLVYEDSNGDVVSIQESRTDIEEGHDLESILDLFTRFLIAQGYSIDLVKGVFKK